MNRALALLLLVAGCSSEATTRKTPSESASSDAQPKGPATERSSAEKVATATAPVTAAPAAPSAPVAAAWPPAGMVAVAGGTIQTHAINDKVYPITVEPFAIDVREVTVAEYRACVSAGKCEAPEDFSLNKGGCSYQHTDRENHPINCVLPERAEDYCASFGKRLPTAAEWQMAASAGGTRKFPWGDTLPTKEMLCWKSVSGTCPVGTHPGGNTPDGIQDLAGNIAELVADKGCIGRPPAGTPCLRPVIYVLGGGWNTFESDGVKAQKLNETIGRPPESFGFRCVVSSSKNRPTLIPQY